MGPTNTKTKFRKYGPVAVCFLTHYLDDLVASPSLLAPQSGAYTIAPHRDPNPTHPIPTQSNPLIALEHENPEKTHDVIYF